MLRSYLYPIVFLLIASCALRSASGQQNEPERPNIILIFADDLGYGDLSSYGHPTIATPNLDRMVAEGMKFTQFYTAAPTCTPSRAALLTGRLPVRSGMTGEQLPVLFPFSTGGLPADERTVAELLGEAGYATAVLGKWHLGHLPPYLPTRHGFDYFFGVPYSNDMEVERRGDPPLPLYRNETVIEQPADQASLTRRYTEEALRFMNGHRDEPFFLYLAHTFPHVPLHASEEFRGTSRRGLYGDVVEEIDWSTGRILDELDSLGLQSSTLVVFTSDNGPATHLGINGGSAGPLRGRKGTTWEGGMRVPAVFRWPGVIKGGSVTAEAATTMDVMPTAVALAGGSIPKDRDVDGRDLSALMKGQIDRLPTRTVFYYSGPRLFAVRHGPWKAHFLTRDRRWNTEPDPHDPPLLYHLGRDPGERFDVAADHLDVLDEITRIRDLHIRSVTRAPSQLSRRD